MIESTLGRDLVIVLLTAFIFGAVAKKLRLPLLVGYLMGGIILGNFITRFFSISFTTKNVAEMGVSLLLFTLGLEFSLSKIKEYGEIIILGSLIQVLLTIISGVVIFPFLGMNFYSSIFLGSVFSLSSTAAVLKILSDKGELETLHGELSAGWLFLQDLYTLPIIIILPAIAIFIKGDNLNILHFAIFGKNILLAFLSFFIIIFFGKKIIPFIFEKIADFKSRELVLIAAVSLCLMFAYIFEVIGLSGALGAFIAGILLSSSSAHHGIFAEIRPLRDLFSTVFFVSLGFIISPEFIFSSLGTIMFLALLVIVLKFVISTVLVILLGFHTKTATLVGFSLVSVGEFAFILALLGINSKLISQSTYMTILSVSFVTLIMSVPLLAYGDRIYYKIKELIIKYVPFIAIYITKLDRTHILSPEILSDHVVILGHGRVGKYICRALTFTKIPFVVVDYNHHLVKKLRSEGINVIYGDPAEIDVLHFARVAKAKVVILAYSDRHTQEIVITNTLTLNPTVKLICRTHFEEDQKKLKSLGVESIVQPEFEAALSMTDRLLRIFNATSDEIYHKLVSLRVEHGMN